MASSGSTDWTSTRNQIIRMAALDINAIGAGVTMSADTINDFDWSLNAMVKAWNATGIHVWTVEEATLFPKIDQVTYEVGTGATDHVTRSYGQTALSADEASGQTVLSIDANTDMVDADHIGVVLDDGSLHWSTISSSTSTTVTIADALASAASEGNAVFFYTSKIVRPLRIVDARRHKISSATDTPIIMAARKEYNDLPLKNQTGTINQMFYDPKLGKGIIKLWQPVSAIKDLVSFTWHQPIEDFDAAGDHPDLPTEWIMALRYNLAESMMTQYPVSDAIARRVAALAAKYLDDVKWGDRENESITFAPDMGP